jgi:hypothetical protein
MTSPPMNPRNAGLLDEPYAHAHMRTHAARARELTAICLIYFIGNNLLHKCAGPFAT